MQIVIQNFYRKMVVNEISFSIRRSQIPIDMCCERTYKLNCFSILIMNETRVNKTVKKNEKKKTINWRLIMGMKISRKMNSRCEKKNNNAWQMGLLGVEQLKWLWPKNYNHHVRKEIYKNCNWFSRSWRNAKNKEPNKFFWYPKRAWKFSEKIAFEKGLKEWKKITKIQTILLNWSNERKVTCFLFFSRNQRVNRLNLKASKR